MVTDRTDARGRMPRHTLIGFRGYITLTGIQMYQRYD